MAIVDYLLELFYLLFHFPITSFLKFMPVRLIAEIKIKIKWREERRSGDRDDRPRELLTGQIRKRLKRNHVSVEKMEFKEKETDRQQ